jgi:hypothetical protein
VSKGIKKIGKSISKPFKKIGSAVKKTVSSVFKAAKGVVGMVAGAIGLTPKIPDMPQPKDPAPPAPEPEQYAEDMTRPENIGRRKRNRRNGLRIDLNTGGAPAGNGVNLPVG